MFSELGPLFKTQFRQTESNDTRQHIPHEERDQNRKKNDASKQEDPNKDLWTDDTSVSVVALKAFLIDFLKTIPGGNDTAFLKEHTSQDDIAKRPKEQKRPTNTRNAKAVRAYQTMATHASQEPPQEEETPKGNEPTADKILSKELRDIHSLIIDLENLEKRNVTMLHIQKAESFVESLKQAVLIAKSKF